MNKDTPSEKLKHQSHDLLYQNGFNINPKKTRYLSGKGNMSVTGVNVNNGKRKIRVIDGGHRTEALKKYFESNNDAKVKVSMAVYKDLSESEERAVYTKWNLGVKQSIDDFIWSYRIEIPEYENILNELPVTVYGSSEKIKARYVIDAYLSSKKHPFMGGCSFGRLEWLEVLRNLKQEDVESMIDTFKILNKTLSNLTNLFK